MNIINTLLILFIILIIINNLTDGQILNTTTLFFNNITSKLSNLINKKAKVQTIKDNKEKISFDTILNKLIVTSNKPSGDLHMNIASKNMVKILEKKLLKLLNNHFNKYNYKFHNLIINNTVEYAVTNDGKYFKQLNISVKLYYKNKKIDNLNFKSELFVKKISNEIVILNFYKDASMVTDILTEVHDDNINQMNNNYQQTNYNQMNSFNQQPNYNQTPNYIQDNINYQQNAPGNFNNLFIQNNNNTSDNNSSLIPSVAEIDLTEVNKSDIDSGSSYSTTKS